MDLYYRQYEAFLGIFKCQWYETEVYPDYESLAHYPANPVVIAELRHATMLEF